MLSALLCLGLPNGLSVQVSWAEAMHNSFPHSCYIPHISSFDSSNNICMKISDDPAHNMVFLIPLFPFSLRPRYHSQHPNLKDPQPMSFLERETGFYTHGSFHVKWTKFSALLNLTLSDFFFKFGSSQVSPQIVKNLNFQIFMNCTFQVTANWKQQKSSFFGSCAVKKKLLLQLELD